MPSKVRPAPVRVNPGPAILRAQPGDPAMTPPFAMIPHHVAADPRIRRGDLAILAALLSFAYRRDRCSPSNASLGEYAHASEATVDRALARLEAAGIIRREKVRPTCHNMTGRVIVLAFRGSPEGASPVTPAPPRPRGAARLAPDAAPPSPATDKEDRRREKAKTPPGEATAGGGAARPTRTTTTGPATPRPPEGPPPPARSTADRPTPGLTDGQRAFLARLDARGLRPAFDARPGRDRARWLEWFARGHDGPLWGEVERTLRPPASRRPIPAREDPWPSLVEALGRGDDLAVSAIAGRLSQEFADHRSYEYYRACCAEVLSGARPVEALTDAYRQARHPRARRPPAVFAHALKRWDLQQRPG